AGRGPPRLVAEDPAEVARAHVDPPRQRLDGQVVRQVPRSPRLQVAQRLPVRRLELQQGTELRLPAGRRTNMTRFRATAKATSRPRSSSTSARARSIPAVTPAEVYTPPSRTKIGSGSTSIRGYCRARRSQNSQWVVASRPSSSPAAASRKAPVQTDPTPRARPAEGRSHRRRSASPPPHPTPPPPPT